MGVKIMSRNIVHFAYNVLWVIPILILDRYVWPVVIHSRVLSLLLTCALVATVAVFLADPLWNQIHKNSK